MLGNMQVNRQYNNSIHDILVNSGLQKRNPGIRAEYDFPGTWSPCQHINNHNE